MDNEETAGVAFGQLSSEFIRTRVVPGNGCIQICNICRELWDFKVAAGATLADGDAVMAALLVALNKMDEDEVPAENRILFITPTLQFRACP